MLFEFNQDLVFISNIDIDNIGEFAIEASNEEGMFWYFIVRTSLGTCSISSCGPVVPDIDLLPSGFRQTFDRIPFKEDKLCKTISMFLNDKSKKITKAIEISIEDAITQFRDLKDYLENYSEEMF